ncbi:MAG: flavin reductase family protein [Myxococcaceae bacterium]
MLNHGPTTLISSAAGGRRNVMAAAWTMPLDFDPPKVAVVIAADTFTRELVDASKELVVQLPTRALLDETWAVGTWSGHDGDKFERLGLKTAAASKVQAPLLEGCVAWLEGKVLPQPQLEKDFDLFLVEVIAAWADDAVWRDGAFHFDGAPDALRTLHHTTRGRFFVTGAAVEAKKR